MNVKNQPIDTLGFSTRVINAIGALGISRVEELAAFAERDLYRLPNLGKKSVLEIRDTLATYGMALGTPLATPEIAASPRKKEADIDALIRQSIARHIPFLEAASRSGCGAADNHLGRIYLEGQGGLRDYRKARLYFIRAARRGCCNGYINLALIYRIGYGVRRSLSKAARLMRRFEQSAPRNLSTW